MHPAPAAPNQLASQWLQRLVGVWSGTDTIHPAPWNPKGCTAQGRIAVRLMQGGLYAILEWTQSRDGVQVFEGHGILCWSPADQHFRMYWFDCHTQQPGGWASGTDEGGVLTLVNRTEQGSGRQRYDFEEGGAVLHFRLDHGPPGGEFQPFMESRYRRA